MGKYVWSWSYSMNEWMIKRELHMWRYITLVSIKKKKSDRAPFNSPGTEILKETITKWQHQQLNLLSGHAAQ